MMTETVTVEQAAPVVQPATRAIDFTKVEALRKHMLLTVASMAALLATSRVTYYNWLSGVQPRRPKAVRVRETVRKLVQLISDGSWSNDKVFMADQPERLEMLQALLKNLDNTPSE